MATSHPGSSDTVEVSAVTPAEDARTILVNKISWGAVLAGVVVALVVQLVINMIGVGIGAATLNPATGDNPSAQSFSIGAGIWWVASGLIASFVGGYAAGRLSGRPEESTASWHGLTTWAFTTLVIVYLLTTAVGGILGGALNTVGSVVGGAGRAAGSAAQAVAPAVSQVTDPFAQIEQSLRSASGGNDPAALRDAAVASVRAVLTGDQAQAQEARERAAQAVAKAQNVPVEEARTRVAALEQQYQQTVAQAKAKATAAAEATAKVVSRGSLLAAFGLLLGALAGWFGGRMGTVNPRLTGGSFLTRRL